MNCSEWEERLSLYAGGDLSPAAAGEVEGHLAGCAGCQMFMSGLKQSLDLLREEHRVEPAPADFTAVRARVLSRIEAARRPFWRRGWALGFATLAAAAVVMVAVRPAHQDDAPGHPVEVAKVQPVAPPVTSTIAPPVVAAQVIEPPAKPHRVRRVRYSRPAPTPPPAGEPVLVRMVSDNPDVVIYWIAETRGDE